MIVLIIGILILTMSIINSRKTWKKVEIGKCNLKCEQKECHKYHHFYLTKPSLDLEKKRV